MVISIVIPSFYPAIVYGGTIYASLHNAKLLTGLGHTVYVSTTNTNKTERLKVEVGKFIELDKNLFVKYYNETIVDKLSLSLFLHLHKDLKHADAVHIQAVFNTPIPLSLFISRLYKKPVLISPHGVLGTWIMNQGSSLKKMWLKFLISPFAKSINWHATSEMEKREILSHFPSANVHVIPNTIDLTEFNKINPLTRSAFLKKFGNRSDNPDKIIISMGRLQKKKGLDILVKAFKTTREKYTNAYLFIAGEDEGERNNLEQLARELHLDNCVFFTGNLSGQDKVDFLGNADLFVLPSHNENFGIVYAEALAAGTPIIASTNTPWEEVEKYNCGKWTSNSIKSISAAILEMLDKNDPSIRTNAKTYVQRFSYENVVAQYENLFKLMIHPNA